MDCQESDRTELFSDCHTVQVPYLNLSYLLLSITVKDGITPVKETEAKRIYP